MESQARNALEMPLIARKDLGAVCKGDASDQAISHADSCSRTLKALIDFGGLTRSGSIQRQEGNALQKRIDCRSLCRTAHPREKLEAIDRRGCQLPAIETLFNPVRSRGAPVEEID